MSWEFADRLRKLPPYLFVEIDNMKKEARKKGVDLIDLGIGDPDMATLKPIVDEMKKTVADPENQHYPLGEGITEFRKSIVNWYKRRFNVNLSPDNEVTALIGSKEGLAHIPLAFVNP
jgi:LL-diaminopimelate aminotransferase